MALAKTVWEDVGERLGMKVVDTSPTSKARRLGRPKAELVLTAEERGVLERLTNRRKTAQALALRARIILACAEKTQPSNPEGG